MNQSFVFFTVPYSSKNPQETHEKNFSKIKSITTEKVIVILKGDFEKVEMNDLAQYYSIFAYEHPNTDVLIVLPPRNIEDYLLNVIPDFHVFLNFENEFDISDVNKKRLGKGLKDIETEECVFAKDYEKEPLLEPLKDKIFSKFSNVYIGGTFDRLHDGHKLLLTQLAYVSKKLCNIAVTSEELLKNKKFKELIEPFEVRCKKSKEITEKIRIDVNVNTCELKDPFGPPITDETVDALVVSLETIKGGEKINEIRREKGWKEINITSIPLIQVKGEKDKMSSTYLREKEAKK